MDLVGTSRPVSLRPSPARQALEVACRCGVLHDAIVDPESGREHKWSAWTHHSSCAHACGRLTLGQVPSTLRSAVQRASSGPLFEHILLCGHTVAGHERNCSENCRRPVCLPLRRGRHTCRFCGPFRADHRFLAWFWSFRARALELNDDVSLLDHEYGQRVVLLENEAFMFVDWLGDRSIWNLMHARGGRVIDVAFVCCLRTAPGLQARRVGGGEVGGGGGGGGSGGGDDGDTGAAFWSRPYEPWVDGWSRCFSPEPSEASVRLAWETEDNGTWQSLHRIVRFIGSSPADWRVHNPPHWSDESLIPAGREANWVISSSIPDIVEEDAAPFGLWNNQSDTESDLGGITGTVRMPPAFVLEHSHVEIPIQRAVFIPGRRLMMKRPAFKLRVLHRIRRTMNRAQWREDYRALAAEQANRHDRIQVLVDLLVAPSVERTIDALVRDNEVFQQEITDHGLDPSNLDIEELTDLLLEDRFLFVLLMYPERFHIHDDEIIDVESGDDGYDGGDEDSEDDDDPDPSGESHDVSEELDDFVSGWQSATAPLSNMRPDEAETGLADTSLWTFGGPGHDDQVNQDGQTQGQASQDGAQDHQGGDDSNLAHWLVDEANEDGDQDTEDDHAPGRTYQDGAQDDAQDDEGSDNANLAHWIIDENDEDEEDEDGSHSDSESDSDMSMCDHIDDDVASDCEMQQDGVAAYSQSVDGDYSDSLMSDAFDEDEEDLQMQPDGADDELSEI